MIRCAQSVWMHVGTYARAAHGAHAVHGHAPPGTFSCTSALRSLAAASTRCASASGSWLRARPATCVTWSCRVHAAAAAALGERANGAAAPAASGDEGPAGAACKKLHPREPSLPWEIYLYSRVLHRCKVLCGMHGVP